MSELKVTFLVGLSFKPTQPAKLSGVATVTATVDSSGSDGSVILYAQHLNDYLTGFSSLEGVLGAVTTIGTIINGTPVAVPEFQPGPNEEILFSVGLVTGTNGATPILQSLSVSWSSDVTAPDAPTITKIVDATDGTTTTGYRVDFAIPAVSRHVIVEGQKNSEGFLPFSSKAKMEAGDYMKFRGDIDAVEAAGERNESHLSFRKGLVIGDVVQIKIAAEDAVGNRSAFTTSDEITIANEEPYFYIEDALVSYLGIGAIKIHLHGIISEPTSVDYMTVAVTAVDGVNYQGFFGTATFLPSENERQTVEIPVNSNATEINFTELLYHVVLSQNTENAVIDRGTGIVTITANDQPTIYIDDSELAFNSFGTIKVHCAGTLKETISVDYDSVNDTAIAGTNYQEITGRIEFSPSESDHQVIEIDVNSTATGVNFEDIAYNIQLSNASGNASLQRATGIVTIRKEDTPLVYVEDLTLSFAETALIKVHLIGNINQEVTVDYTTVAGTATTPEHFTPVSGTLTFPVSSDEHQVLTVLLNGNGTAQNPATGTYILRLSNVTGGAVLERTDGTVTVKTVSYIPYPVAGGFAVQLGAVRRWGVTWK